MLTLSISLLILSPLRGAVSLGHRLPPHFAGFAPWLGGEEGRKGKNLLCQPQQPHYHLDQAHRAGMGSFAKQSALRLLPALRLCDPFPPPQPSTKQTRPSTVCALFVPSSLWKLSLFIFLSGRRSRPSIFLKLHFLFFPLPLFLCFPN